MSINIVEDILKHDDADIIEYLANELGTVRSGYNKAMKENSPERLMAYGGSISIVYAVLAALDKRNKEHRV